MENDVNAQLQYALAYIRKLHEHSNELLEQKIRLLLELDNYKAALEQAQAEVKDLKAQLPPPPEPGPVQ